MFNGSEYNILLSTAGCRIKRNDIIIVSLGPRISLLAKNQRAAKQYEFDVP